MIDPRTRYNELYINLQFCKIVLNMWRGPQNRTAWDDEKTHKRTEKEPHFSETASVQRFYFIPLSEE